MDTKSLRQKILDLAIRGKLVPQDPNDEPASVLLERIRAEKQQMVKDGKLKAKDIKGDSVIFKGEDNLHYEKMSDGTVKCIEEEIPFEVPDSWVWARLGTICLPLQYGTSKKSDKIGKTPVIRMGNIQGGEIEYDDLAYSSDAEDLEKYSLKANDLLFNRTNSPEWVGKTAIYRGNIPAIFAGYLIRIVPVLLNPLFLNQVMNSGYEREYCVRVKTDGVNQSNVNAQKIACFLIPVPPENEQRMIAVAITSAVNYINYIGSEKTELQTIIAQVKAKILNLAIRGKLAPQNPDDEPASALLERIRAEKEGLIKTGKIKRDKNESYIFRGDDKSYYQNKAGKRICFNNSVPFEIPIQWEWCQLGELCDYGNCSNIDTASLPDDAWILDLEDIEKDTGRVVHRVYAADRKSSSTKHGFHKGQLLYSKLRPYLNKVLIADEHGFCTSEILPLEFANILFPPYARHVLMSGYFLSYANKCSYGVKMPRLGTYDGKQAWIPIPPLPEQHRIVTAIDAAFTQLDAIADTLA